MARVWSSGFELNSAADEMEWNRENSGSFATVQSTTVHGGSYAAHFTGFSSNTAQKMYRQFLSSAVAADYYARIYFYVVTLPNTDTTIFSLSSTSGGASGSVDLNLNSSGQLKLRMSSAQQGSLSSALSLNTWYRLEIRANNTGAAGTHSIEARINGVAFASVGSLTVTNVAYIRVGRLDVAPVSTVGDWYIDDVALNNATGSDQNTWPGEGKIVHLMPNAAGDSTTWTPISGANYTNVDEVPPNDATDGVRAAVGGNVDDYNIDDTPADLDASATVNVVHVGVRYNGNSATQANNATFKVRFKKASGGTVSESPGIQPAFTTYLTNANAVPRVYPLTLYQNPDSTSIAKATLDTSQIGVNLSTTSPTGTDVARVSAIWALVEYVPSSGGTATTATGIPTGMAFGTLAATLGAVSTGPAGIPSGEAVGTPASSSSIAAAPTGVPSAEAVGTPTSQSTITSQSASVSSGEAVGSPTASGSITTQPTGISSAEAVGSPAVQTTTATATTGIASADNVPSPAVSTLISASSTGIPSEEAFGAASSATTVPTAADTYSTGIPSQEAFGSPTVVLTIATAPAGIPPRQAQGSPAGNTSIVTAPKGIPTAERFGIATVHRGTEGRPTRTLTSRTNHIARPLHGPAGTGRTGSRL
jgi:hypothetical protein